MGHNTPTCTAVTILSMSRRLRHRTLAVNLTLGVALVAVAVWGYLTIAGGGRVRAATGTRTTAVSRGPVLATVSASGTVGSADTRAADFVTSGTVTAVDVKPGDHVTKGDVLAKVDATDANADLRTDSASLTAARLAYSSAEDAPHATDQSVASAKSQYYSALKTYNAAVRAVNGTVLHAPMSGTVTAVNGEVGGSSSGSGSNGTSGTGSTGSGTGGTGGGTGTGSSSTSSTSTGSSSTGSGFVEIADMSDLQVTGAFSEADALKIKKGQAATVTLNADSGKTIAAKVSAVDPQATTSNNVVQYGVTLALTSQPSGLRLGQTASVEVVTAKADDALYVPSTAVKTAGGGHTVTVLANGKQRTQTVQVGVTGDDSTQITSGLHAGEQVVLPTQSSGSSGFPGGSFPGTRRGVRVGGGGNGGGGPR